MINEQIRDKEVRLIDVYKRQVSLMGQATAGIETRKGPASLRNTPLFEEHLMTDTEETHVFSGNAREAIGLLPTKVNVAVASSLATVGPENTSVNITSVPGFVGDDHKICLLYTSRCV